MKIKPSSVKRVLTVVCQKALLSIAEFVLLVTVAAYVSTFIEQTNNSLTVYMISYGLLLAIALRSINQLWQVIEKGSKNDTK